MYCPNCGKDSALGSKFCENCGTALPADQTTQAANQQYAQTPPTQQAPPYGQPQYGQPQYGQPQYGQPQYGQPYGQPMYPAVPLKNAGLAAVLAFLWAGLGHIYLGMITKGILYMILYVILWVVGFFVGVFTFGIGFLIPIIFWIWQVYDAYKLSNQYNSAVQQTGRAPW